MFEQVGHLENLIMYIHVHDIQQKILLLLDPQLKGTTNTSLENIQ